jgi:hypothetical protein
LDFVEAGCIDSHSRPRGAQDAVFLFAGHFDHPAHESLERVHIASPNFKTALIVDKPHGG